MTVSTMRKVGLAGAAALIASSAHAAVSSGAAPITGIHQIHDKMLVEAIADLSGLIEHSGSLMMWTGLATALFVCLWVIRYRPGQVRASRSADSGAAGAAGRGALTMGYLFSTYSRSLTRPMELFSSKY